tara:strand:- start:961 stop:1614 length:654 start_codon:yes stop_codon:yes gene_type:complete
LILAKRISEDEKKEIIEDFINNKTLEEISEKFNFTKLTISRHLKKSLGDEKYKKLKNITKKNKRYIKHQDLNDKNYPGHKIEKASEEIISKELLSENEFFEITPLNLEIDKLPQKDLSSQSINEVDLPKVVYLVVNKEVELEIKLLREYQEWNFLSEKDLSRNTIEIFYEIKAAKRSINKDQRVLKVPNSDVLKITAPILRARGISRIVCSEALIAL